MTEQIMQTSCSDLYAVQVPFGAQGQVPGAPDGITYVPKTDGMLIYLRTGEKPTYQINLAWPENMEEFRQMIDDAAREHDVPPALVAAVALRESFIGKTIKPSAVSPAGATGVMQLMPQYADEMAGRQVEPGELLDPRTNIWIGTRWLRKLLDVTKGNVILTLASYNAGIGGAKRCGSCTCWSDSCQPDPWGIKTDCGYIMGAIGFHNQAVTQGFSPWLPSQPPVAATAKQSIGAKLAVFGLVTAIVTGVVLANR